jgi:hypothetical protein
MLQIARKLLEEHKSDVFSNEKRTRASILSLLIHANTALDLPENQRMSDDEVVARKYE